MRQPASLALALLVALVVPSLASTPRLHAISFTDHDGETLVSLAIDASVSPKVQMLSDHRLVLDLAGVLPELRSHTIDAGTPRLTRIRVGIHGVPPSLTRVVLDLTGPTSYEVVPTAQGLEIDLRASGAPRRLPAAPTPLATAPATPDAGAPKATPDASASAPKATPNASAKPRARPDRTTGAAPAAPVPTAATAEAGSNAGGREPTDAIPGGLVTVDFRDADVRTVIDLVANVGGYDVIYTPEVQGTVTVRIVDQPWEDALETVLEKKGLRATRHADLILVSPGRSRTAPPRDD